MLALTFDIDWAPDWIVDDIAEQLIERRVKATWFVTHASPAVERLKAYPDLFELGIHPNFFSGSTHGTSEDDVLAHVKQIVSEATTMRTHGLHQSTNLLLKAATQFGIEVDASLYLRGASHLAAHEIAWGAARLWRVPYCWEDDFEMFAAEPAWRLSDFDTETPGLKVFDFHPVHVALNTTDYRVYETLKQRAPLPRWSRELVQEAAGGSHGPRTMLTDLTDALTAGGAWISELAGERVA